MSPRRSASVFWDLENVHPPPGMRGGQVAERIRRSLKQYGSISSFKAYLETGLMFKSSRPNLIAELQDAGVDLVDCPHNGKKDVVDKMIIVDAMVDAVDHPKPRHTIVLITDDRDYSYLISTLKLRGRTVVLIASHQASRSLKADVSHLLSWEDMMEDCETDEDSEIAVAPNRDWRLAALALSITLGTTTNSEVPNHEFRPLVDIIQRFPVGKRRPSIVAQALITGYPDIYGRTLTRSWKGFLAEAGRRGIVKDRGDTRDLQLKVIARNLSAGVSFLGHVKRKSGGSVRGL